jgi:hypothetical protein
MMKPFNVIESFKFRSRAFVRDITWGGIPRVYLMGQNPDECIDISWPVSQCADEAHLDRT